MPTPLAIHDCDIVTYDRSLLARLLYPVAHPQFNYEFCKGYYVVSLTERSTEGSAHAR